MSETTIDWKTTGHTFTGGDRNCDRCGVKADRAIHSKGFHDKLGLPFVENESSDG